MKHETITLAVKVRIGYDTPKTRRAAIADACTSMEILGPDTTLEWTGGKYSTEFKSARLIKRQTPRKR